MPRPTDFVRGLHRLVHDEVHAALVRPLVQLGRRRLPPRRVEQPKRPELREQRGQRRA